MSSSNQSANLENAVAEMRRQLRAQSKAFLIKSWISLYVENMGLKFEIEKLKNTEASALVEKEAK